jgi:RNA-directed DNA polymerase
MGQRVRGWRIHLKVSSNLADLARWMNPIVAGWMQYYGRFYRTELYPILLRINSYVMRWARSKYRRLHGYKKAKAWWDAVCDRYPRGFAHWQWTRGLQGSGHSARRVGSVDRLTWGFVATGTLLLAWGAS